MKHIQSNNVINLLVILILVSVSIVSFYIYFSNGQNLLYGDAVSRLNISRKIIDNLTPGLAQLGNVWLPLPQLFMLPLIGNSILWHSGIAGAIMSMTAYVIGGIYLFKSLKLLTNSAVVSILSFSIYVFNINLLYYQTTAMSETLFICTLCISIYYFLKWMMSKNRMYLMPAALGVSALTLVRYEALAILLASIPMVFFYSWKQSRRYHNAESNTILYATLACLGFGLWTIYLWTIFGDPLYWKNYYASAQPVVSGATEIKHYASNLSFFDATWKYFTAAAWMNGLIPTILAVIALPLLIYRSLKDKSYYFLPVLLSLAIFAFMILTLMRNTPIEQPDLTLTNIFSPETNKVNEFNIRYGLLMLPIIVLLCSYLFKVKFVVLRIVLFGLLCIQFYSYFKPTYTVIFQIPISIADSVGPGGERYKAYKEWLKDNYDQGLIMISALKHDPQMFQLGLDYKTYIHEGTGRYWKESIKYPQRYATWIVMDSYNKDDQVTKFLKNSPYLKSHYNLVYNNDGMRIYKIKTKPEKDVVQ
jgi:hypothetical protein